MGNIYSDLIASQIQDEKLSRALLAFNVEQERELNKQVFSAEEKESHLADELKKAEERKEFFNTVDKVAGSGGALLSIAGGFICLSGGALIPAISLLASGTASLSSISGIASWLVSKITSNETIASATNIALGGIAVVGAMVGGVAGAHLLTKSVSIIQGGISIIVTPFVSYVNYKEANAQADSKEATKVVEVLKSDSEMISTAIKEQMQIDQGLFNTTAEVTHIYEELVNTLSGD